MLWQDVTSLLHHVPAQCYPIEIRLINTGLHTRLQSPNERARVVFCVHEVSASSAGAKFAKFALAWRHNNHVGSRQCANHAEPSFLYKTKERPCSHSNVLPDAFAVWCGNSRRFCIDSLVQHDWHCTLCHIEMRDSKSRNSRFWWSTSYLLVTTCHN